MGRKDISYVSLPLLLELLPDEQLLEVSHELLCIPFTYFPLLPWPLRKTTPRLPGRERENQMHQTTLLLCLYTWLPREGQARFLPPLSRQQDHFLSTLKGSASGAEHWDVSTTSQTNNWKANHTPSHSTGRRLTLDCHVAWDNPRVVCFPFWNSLGNLST